MATTIGVISIKGGVGKTTVTTNLGAVIASKFDKKVLVVDANFSAPNVGLHLGIVEPEKTLNDVMNDKCSIFDAIIHMDDYDVLPSSLLTKRVSPFKLKQKLSYLKNVYDYIVVDSSPNLNDEMLATMLASDQLLVVTSPDYPTLSCTMHATKVAKQKNVPILGLVVNKVRGKSFEVPVSDIEDATGVPVLAVIGDDIKVLEALSHSIPATMYAPRKDFTNEYSELAAAMIGADYPTSKKLSAVLKKLMGKKNRAAENRKLLRAGKL